MTPAEERCSIWQWLSIAPGKTRRPEASISRAPAASPRPSAAMVPSLIATSHSVVSEAVATVPLRMTRSKSAIAVSLTKQRYLLRPAPPPPPPPPPPRGGGGGGPPGGGGGGGGGSRRKYADAVAAGKPLLG